MNAVKDNDESDVWKMRNLSVQEVEVKHFSQETSSEKEIYS